MLLPWTVPGPESLFLHEAVLCLGLGLRVHRVVALEATVHRVGALEATRGCRVSPPWNALNSKPRQCLADECPNI